MAWSFIGTAVSTVGFTGTDTSLTIPATVQDDDLLHLTVLHRDTLTPPSGWTLVDSTSIAATGYDQYTSIYVKNGEDADASATLSVTQASSARLEICISVFRPSTGSWFLEAGSIEKGTSVLPPLVLEGVSSFRGLVVFGCTNIFSSTNTQYTFSDNLIRAAGSSSSSSRRVGVGYRIAPEETDTYTASVNVTGDASLGGVLAFFTESEDPAPSRVNQLLAQAAVKGAPSPTKINQFLLQVAVKIPPEESPSRVNQLPLQAAVRRRNRRVIAMAD